MPVLYARGLGLVATAVLCLAGPARAHDIHAVPDPQVAAPFDIVESWVVTDNGEALFRTRVRADAGKERPGATGQFGGSRVYAYVWPTSLDSWDVGFERGQGIVALAITFHPDFDDAARGGVNRDRWHAHWVVLAEDRACPGGLKVRDIARGATPRLPPNWPGAPILIDSPEYPIALQGGSVEVRVPLADIGALASARFDGVTATLRVDASLHAPLLCVTDVHKIVSGNLSLPGRVVPAR